jgi:hypothetical protein
MTEASPEKEGGAHRMDTYLSKILFFFDWIAASMMASTFSTTKIEWTSPQFDRTPGATVRA